MFLLILMIMVMVLPVVTVPLNTASKIKDLQISDTESPEN